MKSSNNFKHPIAYQTAFIVGAVFPILGFIAEFLVSSKGVEMPTFPVNLYILLGIILVLVFIHIFLSKYSTYKWLISVPVSISAISYTSFLVLIMALLPQNDVATNAITGKLGLNHIANNWAMLSSSTFLLFVLGLVILNRLASFTFKNLVFILNHLGLWITIAAASLGSGDLQRLTMTVTENSEPEWRALNGNQQVELPVAVQLIDFDIEEFNPEIALLDNATGEVIIDAQNRAQMIELGHRYSFKLYDIVVEKYFESAMRFGKKYVVFYDKGAAPAAKIQVYDKNDSLIASDWISSESYMLSPQILELNSKHSLGLLKPSPKEYSSKIKLFAQDGTIEEAKIVVNKPYSFKGWKIYQLAYDKKMGKWSETSNLEFVRDPWLAFVYIGIFMVLIGAVILFWIGKKSKQ